MLSPEAMLQPLPPRRAMRHRPSRNNRWLSLHSFVECLRCEEAEQIIAVCKETSNCESLKSKLTREAREAQRYQDIRDHAIFSRAQREEDEVSGFSFGFSIDSDGHWHQPTQSIFVLQRLRGLATLTVSMAMLAAIGDKPSITVGHSII